MIVGKMICTVKEQPGDRWFLEQVRYDAGSSPMARSRAEFIARCYKMWRHIFAFLMDTRNSMQPLSYSCILQQSRQKIVSLSVCKCSMLSIL